MPTSTQPSSSTLARGIMSGSSGNGSDPNRNGTGTGAAAGTAPRASRVDQTSLDAFERKLRGIHVTASPTSTDPLPSLLGPDSSSRSEGGGGGSDLSNSRTAPTYTTVDRPRSRAGTITNCYDITSRVSTLDRGAPAATTSVAGSKPIDEPRFSWRSTPAAIVLPVTQEPEAPISSAASKPEVPTSPLIRVAPVLPESTSTSSYIASSLPRPPSSVSSVGASVLNPMVPLTHLTRGITSLFNTTIGAPLTTVATAMTRDAPAQLVHLAREMGGAAAGDDPDTEHARKVLMDLDHMYARIGDAVLRYQEAMVLMVEAEASLADTVLGESNRIKSESAVAVTTSSSDDTSPSNHNSTSTAEAPKIGDALEQFGRTVQGQALTTVAYLRALSSFSAQLQNFQQRALADAVMTLRAANAAHTELELYRSTGLAHLVAGGHVVAQGLRPIGDGLWAPIRSAVFSTSGSSGFISGHGSSSRGSIDKVVAAAVTASHSPQPLTSTSSAEASTDAVAAANGHEPLPPAATAMAKDSTSATARPFSAGTFDADNHASSLRERHDRLVEAVLAKTAVLEDKVAVDLMYQVATMQKAAASSGRVSQDVSNGQK
ncbi:hypothetical protein BC828DRAFT_436926 [Blastocladiella britannica]|nr:hypothetical protein BC828DRAFT_436926 [Blastocladiella britannica]